MRRLALLLIVGVLVATGLLLSGIVDVKVNVRPPGPLEAKPFWREVRSDGALPRA